MLSVLTGAGSTKVRINFSSLSLMQECWRKVDYSLNRNLRAQSESPATLFGSAIHKALEVYYSAPRITRNMPAGYMEIFEMIGLGHWKPEWEEETVFTAARAFVLKAEPLSPLPPEDKRSIVTGVWLLRHYFTHYVGDPFIVLSDAAGPLVERRFTLPLDCGIELFGTIDCVLQNEQTGQVLICDHKTTSQLWGFYNRCKPNHQYTTYVLGAQRCLGLTTEDFLVNAIETKAIPKTARGAGPQFARQVTTRTREDIDEFLSALTHSVREYLSLRERGDWPMSAPGPCSNYGGCQFLDICGAPQELRESVIKAKYQERT